jgi:NodT family efflux transporter outer membrane factor (OMF) lipoprotein
MTGCRPLIIVAVAGWVAGCAVGPDYLTPHVPTPASFGGSSDPTGTVTEKAAAADIGRWWRALRDHELDSLVDRAIAGNPDVEIALMRVQQTREREIVVIGAALPKVGISSAEAISSGQNSTKGRVAQTLNSGVDTTNFQAVTQVSGFDAGWELDLFGKYRRELEATIADAQALYDVRNAVLITVISDVARNYVVLRGLQAQIAAVRANIANAEKTVNLVQTRFERGLTNELDVILAKRELATLQSQLPNLLAAVTDAESRIALLLGSYSHDVAKELEKPGKIPHTPERVRSGQPVDLLRRRPDIRRAERELAAATARIGVATADLFPTVAVLAGLGLQGGPESAGNHHHLHAPLWSFGPGAYWPVLDFGRLDAAIDAAEFQARANLVNYERTIQAAVEEVVDAMKRYREEVATLRSLTAALDEAKRAVTVSSERYERGLTDFLNVLDASRQEYALETQVAVEQAAVAIQYVALYKALGGGWELYQDLPPIPVPEPAVLATFRRLSDGWH